MSSFTHSHKFILWCYQQECQLTIITKHTLLYALYKLQSDFMVIDLLLVNNFSKLRLTNIKKGDIVNCKGWGWAREQYLIGINFLSIEFPFRARNGSYIQLRRNLTHQHHGLTGENRKWFYGLCGGFTFRKKKYIHIYISHCNSIKVNKNVITFVLKLTVNQCSNWANHRSNRRYCSDEVFICCCHFTRIDVWCLNSKLCNYAPFSVWTKTSQGRGVKLHQPKNVFDSRIAITWSRSQKL